MNDLHALAAFKALDEGRLQPVDKGVEVTQADRNEAARMMREMPFGGMVGSGAVEEGENDGHRFVQAFARHRHQSETGAALPSDGREALRRALRPFASAAKWWKAFDNQHRITTLHQHGDCLEVGHLRAAEAALAQPVEAGEDGLRAQIAKLEDERDEALAGPWPKWASDLLDILREYTGPCPEDSWEGVDLPEEMRVWLEGYRDEMERAALGTRP